MRWFKHESNSHNDEKMREIIHEFGAEGYGIYMIILELIAEKIDSTKNPTISISQRVLREKCRVSRRKLSKILSFFGENSNISVINNESFITLTCPNLLKRLDNWTTNNKKLTSNLQVSIHQPEPEVEPEVKNQKVNREKDGFFSEKQKQIVLGDISKANGVSQDSESAKLRLEEIIAEVAKVKDVNNPLALARHKALKQK